MKKKSKNLLLKIVGGMLVTTIIINGIGMYTDEPGPLGENFKENIKNVKCI